MTSVIIFAYVIQIIAVLLGYWIDNTHKYKENRFKYPALLFILSIVCLGITEIFSLDQVMSVLLFLNEPIIYSLLTASVLLFGGFLLGRKALEDQYKKEVARSLFANVHGLNEPKTLAYENVMQALNSVNLVFAKDQKVQEALSNLYTEINKGTDESKITALAQTLFTTVGRSSKLLTAVQQFNGNIFSSAK